MDNSTTRAWLATSADDCLVLVPSQSSAGPTRGSDLANVSEEGLIADAGMGTVGVEVTRQAIVCISEDVVGVIHSTHDTVVGTYVLESSVEIIASGDSRVKKMTDVGLSRQDVDMQL